MARPKLTPMQFRRKYCKHEPRFAPEPVTPVPPMMVIAHSPAPVKAKAV